MQDGPTGPPTPLPADGWDAVTRDVMYVLCATARPNGTAIRDALNDSYPEREVFKNRLYPRLDDLASEGFVAKGEQNGRSNYYELTAAGQERVLQHLAWVLQHTGTQLEDRGLVTLSSDLTDR